jgi:hypothetical protein
MICVQEGFGWVEREFGNVPSSLEELHKFMNVD